MTVALLALAAIPPFAGFFSKEAVLVAAEHTALGDRSVAPAAAGWTILVAGLLAAVLTAAYAVRLWLLAFRGRGAEVPDHGKQPAAMTSVLWILAVPTIGFGVTVGMIGDWFDGHGLTPSLTTAVLSTGVTLVGGLVTYGAWRHTTALAARTPIGAVVAHPGAEPALVEAEAMTSHTAVYGTIAGAPDPADPGRLLLGPLHRHAATGFHLDALYTVLFVRPVQGAARLVRFLDREVVDTYVNGTGAVTRLLGTAVRRAQTGNVQTYVSALLAGSLVLVIAAVVFANVNAGS